MAVFPINPMFTVLGMNPLYVTRNHVATNAQGMRDVADYYNFLLARPKVLGSIHFRPTSLSTSTSDVAAWRFAFRTGPITSHVHIEWLCIPNSGGNDAVPSRAYLSLETLLSGTGTTTVCSDVFVSESNSGTIVPDDYIVIRQAPQPVTADTLYRGTVHFVNGFRAIGIVVWERPRMSIDPAVDTSAVNPAPFYYGGPIFDAQLTDLTAAQAKVWTRKGKGLFWWTVPFTTAVTRTTGTAANILDQTVTAWDAAAPGFPVNVQYSHSHDSTDVPVRVYCYASVAGAGTGKVEWFVDGATVASIDIAGAAAWYEDTGVLDGTNASDKIDVLITGDGSNVLSVYCAGGFVDQ